jgi:hypothetical protein
MKTFAITGRCNAAPPPADWREQLARMLGAKPRRIGTWAELGIYGALNCMADAGEKTLQPDAQIWLGSQRGTYAATATVLSQLGDDLPMPLAFLQTQPSQLLAMLAAKLEWKGQACFMAGSDPLALLRLAATQAGRDGLLLGWLDEMEGGTSNWLRLKPCEEIAGKYALVSEGTLFAAGVSHLRLDKALLESRLSDQSRLGASGSGMLE